MLTLDLLKGIFVMKQRARMPRQQLLEIQEQSFRNLLLYVWNHSKFYRELYSDHGITEEDLPTVKLSELPIVDKPQLMQHFDKVVTDPELKMAEIEQWLAEEHPLGQRYKDKYVIIHTSGSSGDIGIFVYSQRDWDTLRALIVARVSNSRWRPFSKIRFSFYASTHGHFAGITLANDAPPLLYNFLPISVLAPFDNSAEKLTEFEPDQLSGYASTITSLAELQKKGDLNISPRKIVSSGDMLTPTMENTITTAWPDADLMNLYAASESIGIAMKPLGEEKFTVFEDMHCVEILDENDKEVMPGKSGSIVLTNLYNTTLPLIRYRMYDVATKGSAGTLSSLHGRVNDALPIVLDNGVGDTMHPVILSEFFVSHLKRIQFISKAPDRVEIHYVADEDITTAVRDEFNSLLVKKGAIQTTTVSVVRKESIPNNEKTGKLPLVIIEHPH